ncbi:MAG: class I SAM-dependent methyltransferase [Leucobacter sp.]
MTENIQPENTHHHSNHEGHEGHGGHTGAGSQAENRAEMHPSDFWEQMYAGADAVWSGRVNETLAELVADLTPGRSLDLGCGEGGDVLWMAERGWEAAGIDLSETAIGRAQQAAIDRGFAHAQFYAADLGQWADQPASLGGPVGPFDLISASFFQSPVELQRERILRAALSRIAIGGHLVLVSHASGPGGMSENPDHFVTPEDELASLALDEGTWRVHTAEIRTRETQHENTRHTLDDTVIVVQRVA